MKELLRQFAAYNTWANQKLCEVILSLPPELHTKELLSSFTSLHETLLHMWGAEGIWWQRIRLQENVVSPAANFSGSTQDVVNALLMQNRQWEMFVNNATDMALDHVFSYYSLKKENFKQPTYQVLLHIMNHNTYHRGQLVSMLRQLGVQKIPQTDYIIWTRKK